MAHNFPTHRLADGTIDYTYYRIEASRLRQEAKRAFWRRPIGRRPAEPQQTQAARQMESRLEGATT